MASMCERRKLIIRVINFELVQRICPRYLNVADRQTDRQTDGRITIAIPCFAVNASMHRTVKFVQRFLCLLYEYIRNKLWCEAQQTPPPAATYRMILTCKRLNFRDPHFWIFWSLWLLLGYIATSNVKSDVIFLLGDPDFL